jgi:hypothetical protein
MAMIPLPVGILQFKIHLTKDANLSQYAEFQFFKGSQPSGQSFRMDQGDPPLYFPKIVEPSISLSVNGFCIGNGVVGDDGKSYADTEKMLSDPMADLVVVGYHDIGDPVSYHNLVVYIEKTKAPALSVPTAMTTLTNNDYEVIEVSVRSSGNQNFKIDRTEFQTITGPEGSDFRYAWKSRFESITDGEFNTYSVAATYGDDIIFGMPPGNIP